MHKRKLIEVALPLEAINRESAREKSIRHGHPSTMHIWWARRPLAAARAVLFAQLVDDPSSRPEEFPTDELQRQERERLHTLIAELCEWESGRNDRLLEAARREIQRSTDGNPPSILDPFAGGGAIPVEAQRLGLETWAADLNPVAVLLNKALIELPPSFVGSTPVWPGLAASEIRSWAGAEGLAADVRAYGAWIGQQAKAKVGDLYPDLRLDDGSHLPALAWIWARTLTCPNPACGIEMPLVRSWWLSKKRGSEAYVAPRIEASASHPSGRRVRFEIVRSKVGAPSASSDGTVGRSGAVCVACDAPVTLEHIRSTSRSVGLGQQLMASVATLNRRRVYADATPEQELAADVELPEDLPTGELSDWPGRINVYRYGLTRFIDLFTPRQLNALVAFSDLVLSAREKVIEDGGSSDYADAIATYLGLCASKMTVFHTSLSRWRSDADKTAPAFGRQAIAMVWDFAEPMPFAGAGGDWDGVVDGAAKTLEGLRPGAKGTAVQAPAQSVAMPSGAVISTDPPYYDNISYAELSDYFYVWLRRVLRPIYPELLSTLLVPKSEELVANPYRHNGASAAKEFFEHGFREVFARARQAASAIYPITVYYAFKQSDSDEIGEASSGWETLLEGMVTSGWEITSTWPLRTEGGTRLIARDSNVLASSIVLSLRPRDENAPTTDRRGFLAALEAELPSALRKLQQGQIAPVDLPQAAIGPGMAVFSRYSAVLEPDGKKMTVRSALSRINEILDHVLNEQEGDFDSPSRFAIAWYRQHGYGIGAFGDANNLANARNTTVDMMDRDGILTSRAGKVQLIKSSDLSWDYDPVKDAHTSNWEALHHLIKVLERDGIAPAGDFLQAALRRPDGAVDADLVKELAHLLFRVAEGNGWTKDALSFNTLVTSWPEILDVARSAKKPAQPQGAFEFDEDE